MFLENERVFGGYQFRIKGERTPSPEIWSTLELELPSGGIADVSAIVDLYQREKATAQEDQSILVQDSDLANFLSYDLISLGLPPAAPVSLSIRTRGLITSEDFSLEYSLVGQDGRPWMGISRDGTFLKRGSKEFSLLDPIYSLLQGIEAFASLGPTHQERFTHWAELEKILPEDVKLDGQLKSLNISSADQFSLDVRDGMQFDPVPLAISEEPGAAESAVVPEYFLPKFQEQFKRFSKAHRTYALGDGRYLMFSPRAQDALNKVRDYQGRPAAERRAFVANPQGFIGGQKETTGSGNDENVPDVFVESPEFLSSRIRELGQWSPKLGAYVSSSGIDWLPEEEIEVMVSTGKESIPVNIHELPALAEKIKEAEANGADTIQINGIDIKITDELKTEVIRLAAKAAAIKENAKVPAQSSQIPILFDNIEELGYQAKARLQRTGEHFLPEALKTRTLYEHQETGLQWLVDHWLAGSRGALLADDMGLGKTLQTLAFMAWIQEVKSQTGENPHPHLIVAPTGLLKNWEDEAEMHLTTAGLGDLIEVFGEGAKRLRSLTARQRRNELARAGWVLTTYETLRDRIDWFIDIPWSVVTFDEAQKIKNPAARVTEMSKSLESEFCLMLTGTPVENSLADLWCIMDGAQPGLLGSQKSFVSTYVNCGERQIAAAQELREKLQESAPPAPMLRRMKEDHLRGLPTKTTKMRDREMSQSQASAYDEVVSQLQSRTTKGGVLEAIQRLKSISLMGKAVSEDGLDQEAIESSARLLETLNILDDISSNGEKALIFIESIELQKRLVPYLQDRYQLKSPPLRISGEIAGVLRKSYVDRFQAIDEGEFAVMLLSPKAGGVGLTLTAANHVIHLSRWWNPAVEDQCTDRVYRIGQENPVTVWYPIATHPRFGDKSFDWNLHKLLEKKRALSKSALIGNVNTDDLKELLGASLT